MADLLALSARIIDSGTADEPVNRVTQELSEVADDVAVVESFSHVVAIRTEDGLVVFDSSGRPNGSACVDALRSWAGDPVHTLVYTHGHLDHVGGSPAFAADADRRGHPPIRFVAHEAVTARFQRYRMTDGWNRTINARQFGWLRRGGLNIGSAPGQPTPFLPDDVADPQLTYDGHHELSVGGLAVELHHDRGETDDHTWAWIPGLRAVCSGDFLIWNFPNAGNPQKVQRYPAEWARALRAMAARRPELLLPAHGLPIAGEERIRTVLTTTADTLEDLVQRTVALMNDGATLDEIVHSVRVPEETLTLPYLRPLYDEPEFVVRNIWRLYGGWWDANPARLKPPPDAAVAAEVSALAGGADVIARRARDMAAGGSLELACQLAEWAAQADPASELAQTVRAEIYEQRHREESSLMSKGIFAGAAAESRRQLEQLAGRPSSGSC